MQGRPSLDGAPVWVLFEIWAVTLKEPVLNYQVFKPFYARLPLPNLN